MRLAVIATSILRIIPYAAGSRLVEQVSCWRGSAELAVGRGERGVLFESSLTASLDSYRNNCEFTKETRLIETVL